MNNNIKWLMIISQAFSNLIFGFTTPIAHIYFISLVEPSIYSLANFIEAALSAIVNSLLSNQKWRHYFKQFALYFLTLDSILYIIIIFLGIDYINIRFIRLATINSLLCNIWFIMLSDALNKNISGDTLTDFKVLQRSWMLWGSLIGSGIGIWINNSISVELALTLQAMSTVVIAVCDGYSFGKLNEVKQKNN